MNSLLTKVYTQESIQGITYGASIYCNDTLNTNAKSIIQSYFQWKYNKVCLISNIQFLFINNKVVIQFYYYLPSKKVNNRQRFNRFKNNSHGMSLPQNAISGNNINTENQLENSFLINLSKVLQSLYGKKVELVLNRIHYPYMNAQIFSQYLCKNAEARTFLHFTRSLFKFPSYNSKDLPSNITGIKITLHGRLITERLIPRKTIKSRIQGRFTSKKGTIVIDKGYTEMKNQLGQFRISVEIAQITNFLKYT